LDYHEIATTIVVQSFYIILFLTIGLIHFKNKDILS